MEGVDADYPLDEGGARAYTGGVGCRALPRSPVLRAAFRLTRAKRVAAFAASIAALAAAAVASAQDIPLPQVGGPAQRVLGQLRPPSPIDQVREQSMRRLPPLPLPAPPSERWVPDRRVYSPELRRDLLIPGHYERRISDQEYAVPPLPAHDTATGFAFTVPGGARPPADLRQGP